MPLYKDASLYFSPLLVINLSDDHISDPNLPKQLHMLLTYACLFPLSFLCLCLKLQDFNQTLFRSTQ